MGADASIQEIYQEYARPVYLYLRGLCHDEHLAEDLTQETFYRAMKGIHRFRGDSSLLTWLCNIGRRLWYQELEKRKKRGVPLTDDENALPSPQDIQEDYANDEQRVLLFRAMQGLEPTVREVVYLRVMGDLSFRQIGDILGKTENWARVTFYRAKEKLKKGWSENE